MADVFKIDVNKEVTSRLGIEPIKLSTGAWAFDGAVPIKWVGASITQQTFEKGQFAGIALNVLNFDFVNYKLNSTDPDRYLTHTEKAIGTIKDNADNDPKAVGKLIANFWGRIKHILDSTKGLVNYRDIAQNKDFLKLIDLPTSGDGAAIAEKYNAFLQFICDFINGDGKTTFPMYITKDGTPVVIWAIVLPAYPDGKWYELPGFVGKGFFERATFDDKKQLNLPKIIKVPVGSTLELTGSKKVTTGMPGAATNIAPGAVPDNIAGILGIK